ncbi:MULTISPECIES: arsenic resistance N-acetyltransferase ArsN2 [unclassified Spirosoma]|uniref:arsenic resistance N-acetyltransferase ArsN2 n=1 Tax=unclassified Spirosoma TaxID=2621999 RepID=UPI00096561C9|nr:MULTISPECIES: arsenic resistance N-acetyltransferase ArsN2 [unclassified Spirosoma]MBN8825967.1 GNAT family N-acetyltransferase [Spirosoma sp.]OJW70998.1 MAG: amino acid acetyltransferase [Spirosoma sp. 48-14]
MAIHIDTARPDDQAAIESLLAQNDLPIQDLPTGLPNFVIAKENETLVGVAGLESFGSVGLLRSVAVDPAHQGKGIAARLLDRLLDTARAANLQDIYLITTTANGYFTRYDFAPISRELVPDPIQQTQQFSGLCPSSAIVMKRALNSQPA